MISQLFSSLAAPAFAALLLLYFLYRRSREINAAANDGTARGDSGTHTPTGVSEVAISSGPAKDAAANDGMARGDSSAHTSMRVVPKLATSSGANKDAAAANIGTARGNSITQTSVGVVPEMATSSGANKDAAANHGMASGDSGTHTPTGVPEMATSSGANKDAAANHGMASGDSGSRTPTGVPEIATSSGEAKDEAVNLGTARGDSGTHTPMGVLTEMATSSGAAKDAVADLVTASGDPGTHTPAGVSEMATSSGPAKDAAANHGMASGDFGTHTSMRVVPEIATSSGANNDAAAFNGMASGDFGTHTSTEVPETDTPSPYDYEIFLSLNGNDTLKTFTDHLYTGLTKAGIRTFKYDVSLRHGEEFGTAILQAIEQSKILIPIFSKNYASRPWCLKELAKMVECEKNIRGQKIIPFFYDVGPDEVRHQSGDYGNAFSSYERKKKYNEKIIKDWRDALKAVAKIEGHDLRNRKEGEFVETFTQKVFNELNMASLGKSDYLVSVDDHVDAIMEMIGAGTSETRIIGIYGMSGIGKTTIAKIIYDKISHDFENCCFLRDIQVTSKNNGFHCVQKQLISSILKMQCEDMIDVAQGTQLIKRRLLGKRVLLLLDNVEEKDHIDALALKGNHDWLGKGSKIIITTTMVGVLKFLEVERRYELPLMDDDQSLELFSKHAFRGNSHSNQYIDKSKRVIRIAGGLPLALEVIGSLLFSTEKGMWDVTLKMLESVPNNEILGKLKISYDKLSSEQQRVFLDVACFSSGYNKDILIHFWEEYEYSPIVDIMFLQNMCLIKTTEDNEVWMHDQLRNLGRKMVRDESKMKREKQSRVWNPREGLDLLRKHKGKKKVEALRLNLDLQPQYCFTYEGFESLQNLRFLGVGGLKGNFLAEQKLLWHESQSNAHPTNENSDLLLQLRWLSWVDIPLTFNIKNFSMEDVVVLDLSGSEITGDWKGWSHMKMMENLKVLDLSNCQRLKRTPRFSAISRLERLILRGCSELVEIHRSMSHLKSLVSLDVRECVSLERLPKELGELDGLQELRIDVTKIQEIPNIGGMRNLRIFTASYCRGLVLPPTIGNLASLEYLCLTECSSLERLPDTIGNLKSLTKLDIYPSNIRELPDSIGRLKNLKVVKMLSDSTSKIPDSFWEIEKLEEIQVTHPGGSESALAEIGNCLDRRTFGIVKTALAKDIEVGEGFRVRIGSPIYRNQSLRILRLSGAKIDALPKLPESLVVLELDKLHMKTFPGLSNLTNLKELRLRFGPCKDGGESAAHVEEDPGLGKLRKLESLSLTSDYVTTLPARIIFLPRLRKLEIRCRNLCCLPSLPSSLLSLFLESECVTALHTDISSLLPRLQTLDLKCPNLHRLPSLPSSLLSLSLTPGKSFYSLDLSNSKKLSNLRVADCAISEIRGLDRLQNLQELHLKELQQVKMLPALSNFNKLSSLTVHDCRNLVEIQGKLPPSLATLEISGCRSLRTLPDLSSLMGLLLVEIKHCQSLNAKAISSLCSKKGVTFLGDEDDELWGEDDEGAGDLDREAIRAYYDALFASFGMKN